MTMSDTTKPGATQSDATTSSRYALFSITFGVVFAIAYLVVMKYGWQLFTYYPKVGQWTLLAHPATLPSPGPGMKWFGYVATTTIVATVAGLIVSLIPEKVLQRVWWSGMIWLVPIAAMCVVLYMILGEGD